MIIESFFKTCLFGSSLTCFLGETYIHFTSLAEFNSGRFFLNKLLRRLSESFDTSLNPPFSLIIIHQKSLLLKGEAGLPFIKSL